MSLFSEFDLFRRSVHQLFSEFERDYLNDRYLLDTHFADYPLLMQQNDNDAQNKNNNDNNNMQIEKQNTNQDTSKTGNKNNSNNANVNAGNNNQLQSRGGGLMNTRPTASTTALLFSPWSSPLSLRSLPQSSCRMDVIEKKDQYEVHAELAGIPKENIKIEVVDGVLTLSGEHRSQIEQKSSPANNNNNNNNEKENNQSSDNKDNQSGQYHYRERSYSSVKRSLRLPENIDTEKIAAKYDNGLLQLTLPKKEIVPPKPINIQIA